MVKIQQKRGSSTWVGGCKFMNLVLEKTALTFEQRPLNNKDGVIF